MKQFSHIHSPEAIPQDDSRVKVFLAGTIDMGNSVDWQAQLAEALADEAVILLNPRRDDWNKEWLPVADNPHFRQQVEWELAALEQADIIVMYFAATSQSPVTLLELGLHAKSHKLIVYCADGYFRKGNVDIVCERYGVVQAASIEGLTEHIKNKLRLQP